ncbi:MAG: hypothetical protein HC769_31315 [Cyanobacteria bacterium CRU_2_1]|nr:hypothetical protein [Cyanobacteria bacterium RU_5_0]NJR62884.1 hypothetical protein [Cyanobacteria bacterium CRU_2_1]
MNDSEKPEDILKQLQERQRCEEKGLTGLEDFSLLQGELPIDPSLELAVMSFVRSRYRGIAQWRIHQTYSFTCEGIFLRTYVESWEPGIPIRFTPDEAIVIARHLSQPE